MIKIIGKIEPDFRYILIKKDKNVYIYDNNKKKLICNHSHSKKYLLNWIYNKEIDQSICSICNNMNNDTILLITVPHGYCPKTIERECDLIAYKSAECIKNIMEKKFGISTIVLVPNREREICDENRNEKCSINSDFRKEIDNTIKLYKNKIKFALDMHSFPDDSDFGPNELFLLDDYSPPEPYSYDFVKDMKKRNISIGWSRGKNNALHTLFRDKYGIKSFLLEINESLESRFKIICENISNEIKKLFFFE
jgi:hypothetical protein